METGIWPSVKAPRTEARQGAAVKTHLGHVLEYIVFHSELVSVIDAQWENLETFLF